MRIVCYLSYLGYQKDENDASISIRISLHVILLKKDGKSM